MHFCELIGDDLSGLAFDDANRPKNPIPPDPDMVLALFMFKCNTPNTTLTYKGSPVITNPGGEVIKCVGAWKCHSNIDSFKGMFNSTHHENLVHYLSLSQKGGALSPTSIASRACSFF